MKMKNILRLFFALLLVLACEKDNEKNPDQSFTGNFGTTNFTLDNSNSQSVTLGNETQTMTVVDKKGVKWTLSVPQQITLSKVDIKMTAINEVTKSPDYCKLTSGVVFEPDGLMFDTPATLTVEFPTSKTSPSVFFHVPGKGSNDSLRLEPASKDGKVYKLNVFHFSGMMSGDPDNLDGFSKNLSDEYQKASENAKNIAKQPLNVPPPPSVDSDHCSEMSSQDAQAKAYADQLSKPEKEAIDKLLSLGKSLQLLGNTSVNPIADALVLSERLYQKAKQIATQYGGNEKQFYPTMVAALQIARQNALLGGDHTAEITALLASKIGTMEDGLINKLRNEHDYTLIKYLFSIERIRALLGGGDHLDKICKAANFEITLTNETMKTDGRMIVIFKINSNVKYTESLEVMTNEGDLDFTSGKVRTASDDCPDPWIYMNPFSSTITTDLVIDPCGEENVKMMFGPIMGKGMFPETSNVLTPKCGRRTETSAFGQTVFTVQASTDLYQMMLDRIVIERSMQNKNPLLIDESFTRSNAAFIITYTVKVEHKPL